MFDFMRTELLWKPPASLAMVREGAPNVHKLANLTPSLVDTMCKFHTREWRAPRLATPATRRAVSSRLRPPTVEGATRIDDSTRKAANEPEPEGRLRLTQRSPAMAEEPLDGLVIGRGLTIAQEADA